MESSYEWMEWEVMLEPNNTGDNWELHEAEALDAREYSLLIVKENFLGLKKCDQKGK